MMNKFFLGSIIFVSYLSVGCVKAPNHSNPYDAATPNTAPRALIARPDSMIVGATAKSIELQWPLAEAVDEGDFEAYVISRQIDGDASFTELDLITSLVRTSYIDRSVHSNTTYMYKVCVLDKGGKLSAPLTVKIRTGPSFAPLGQLPGFMVSQSAANCSRRSHATAGGSDTGQILFVLGTSEKQIPMVSFLKIKQRVDTAVGSFTPMGSFFLDGAAPGSKIKAYPVNGITPLENSIFKKVAAHYSSLSLFSNDTIDPLGRALDSEVVIYHKIKYGAISSSQYGDTVFIGIVNFFELRINPGYPNQLGFAGVLRYILSGPNYRYDTLLQLPVARTAVRDDHYISALEASDIEPNLYLAGPGIMGLPHIYKWNYKTGVVDSTNRQIIDPEHLCLRVVRGAAPERIIINTYNDIKLVTNLTSVSLAPKGYLSNVNRFDVGSDNLVYAIDAGNSGISVIDAGTSIGSGSPSLVSKWTSIGNTELEFGTNDYVFALGSIVVFTLNGSTLWRTY